MYCSKMTIIIHEPATKRRRGIFWHNDDCPNMLIHFSITRAQNFKRMKMLMKSFQHCRQRTAFQRKCHVRPPRLGKVRASKSSPGQRILSERRSFYKYFYIRMLFEYHLNKITI